MNNKKHDQKRLPDFEAEILDADQLRNVVGGMMPSNPPTTSTHSKCHVDGLDDLD